MYLIHMNGCVSTGSTSIVFPLMDDKAVIHQYKDNFDKLIFPRHNEKLTQYCSVHLDWEDIKAKWSKNNQHEFKWQYYVSKHTKRHK